LQDDQWNRIKGPLPGREGDIGVTARSNRLPAEVARTHGSGQRIELTSFHRRIDDGSLPSRILEATEAGHVVT
jgi:hypothetical protein